MNVPFCWQHLRSECGVTVRNSPIHGKGLFAWARGGNNDVIVFKRGQRIAPYDGELLTHAEFFGRYGLDTAPYGVKLSEHRFVDGAYRRGAGAVANAPHGGMSPNARLVVNSQQGSVSLRATKNVRNNEEILVSYGPGYWNQPMGSYKTKQSQVT
jgi:hypothetical protein